MTIDVSKGPGRWFRRLFVELHGRRVGSSGGSVFSRSSLGPGNSMNGVRPGLNLLAKYKEGDPPLTDLNAAAKPHLLRYIRMGRLNIAELLVESTQNRMVLRDFKTSAVGDEQGDARAREIMRANQLQLISRDVHDWLLTFGDAYTLVTPPTSKFEWSRITAEDPRECITWDNPLTGEPEWGLKLFRDEWDEADVAFLYGPNGEVWQAEKPGATTIRSNMPRFDAKAWSWTVAVDPETGSPVQELSSDGTPPTPAKTPDGRMPLVHFRNKHGVGEFEQHLDHLDRINDKILNEWWSGKMQAFRQRAVKNLPEEDDDGNEIDYTGMFDAAPDEVWQLPEGAEFWESQPLDLTPILSSIQKDLERLAAVKQQPLHTITPDAANGSAEGASLMREEHLYKIGDRIDRVNPGWAATMSRAFAYMAVSSREDKDEFVTRADVTQIEAMWGPTERYSLQQKASAASQLNGQGGPVLPKSAIWTEVLQFSPAEVAGLRTQMGSDLVFQPPGQAATVVPGVPAPDRGAPALPPGTGQPPGVPSTGQPAAGS